MNLSDIEAKIKNDLKKSGFYSEMKALEVFKEKKWIATGVTSFFDLDENKSRESDISARIQNLEEVNNKTISNSHFNIVAEVKKSERPWIIFKEIPHWDFKLGEAWSSVVFRAGFPKGVPASGLTNALQKNSMSRRLVWIGSGMHEFNKNPDQPSRWYSSLVSVCKAAEDKLKGNSWKEKKDKDHYPYLFFVKPVIILDAPLISASLKNSEIELEEINYATVEFDFKTDNYDRGTYKVDIVTLDSLPEYLDICNERQQDIAKQMKIVGNDKVKNSNKVLKRN